MRRNPRHPPRTGAYDRDVATELPIIQCTLDQAGAKEQAARYAEVAKHVQGITRAPRSLTAAVDAEVDATVLGELIPTERACCPFFQIAWSDGTLTVEVRSDDHAPALDVIAQALSA